MKVEIRGESVRISGYVNAVERDSKVMRGPDGPFIERVEAGAFQRALTRAANVKIKLNHQRDIGSVKEGNLTLHEDNVGLYAQADITDPETVREARAGNLTGWSFGFADLAPCFEPQEGTEVRRRTLKEFELDEVSVLTIAPAYLATSIEARCEGGASELRSCEDALEVQSVDYATEMAAYRIKRLKMED